MFYCARCLYPCTAIDPSLVDQCENCEAKPFWFTTDYLTARLSALIDRRLRISDEDHAKLISMQIAKGYGPYSDRRKNILHNEVE